jgi:hypothetical protein
MPPSVINLRETIPNKLVNASSALSSTTRHKITSSVNPAVGNKNSEYHKREEKHIEQNFSDLNQLSNSRQFINNAHA